MISLYGPLQPYFTQYKLLRKCFNGRDQAKEGSKLRKNPNPILSQIRLTYSSPSQIRLTNPSQIRLTL